MYILRNKYVLTQYIWLVDDGQRYNFGTATHDSTITATRTRYTQPTALTNSTSKNVEKFSSKHGTEFFYNNSINQPTMLSFGRRWPKWIKHNKSA